MAERMERRESFMEGFRRSAWLLLLPVLFCTGVLVLSLLTNAGILSRRGFITVDPDASVMPGNYSEETEEAVGGGIEISLTEPVTEEYFKDALFMGDSITSGLTIYDMFEGFNAIYKVGVSPMTATSISFTTTATGNDLTMSEAVKYYNPRKLYIMLGTNGINWASADKLLEGYRKLVKILKDENPDCMIIVQSIPPVAKWVADKDRSFSKENFDEYNAGLRQMCIDMGIYFLDINAAFTTEDGYLSSDYSAPDGIHFGYVGYQKWYDYLMCHTVHGSSAYCIGEDGFLKCNN